MTSETIRIEKLTLAPTTPIERAVWVGATVDHALSEIVVRSYSGQFVADSTAPEGRRPIRPLTPLRFESAAEVAALEDALRVMRVRMEERERAALSK